MIRHYTMMNFSFVFISVLINLIHGYDHDFDRSIGFAGDSEFTTPKDSYLDRSHQTGPPWSNDPNDHSPPSSIESPFIQNFLERGPRGSDSFKFNGEYSDGFTGFHSNHDRDKSSHEPSLSNEPSSPENNEYIQRDHFDNSGHYINKDSPSNDNSEPYSNNQYNVAQYGPDVPNDTPSNSNYETPPNSNNDPSSSYNEFGGSYDNNEQYSGEPYGSGGQGNNSNGNYSKDDSTYQSEYPDSNQYDQPNDQSDNSGQYNGGYNDDQQNSVGDDYEDYSSYQQENTSQMPPLEQGEDNGSDYKNKMDYLYKDSPSEILNREKDDYEVREVSSKDQANSSVSANQEKSKSDPKVSKNREENSNNQKSPLVHLEFNYGRENGGIQGGSGSGAIGPGLPPGTHLTNNYHFAPIMTPPQHSPYIQNQIPSVPVYSPNYQYNQNGQQQFNPNIPTAPIHNPNYQYNQRGQQQIQTNTPSNPSGVQNNNDKNSHTSTKSPVYVAHLYLPPVNHKPKDGGYLIVDSGDENRGSKSLMLDRQDAGMIRRDEPLIILQEPRSDDSDDCGSKRKSRRESRKKRRRCYKNARCKCKKEQEQEQASPPSPPPSPPSPPSRQSIEEEDEDDDVLYKVVEINLRK